MVGSPGPGSRAILFDTQAAAAAPKALLMTTEAPMSPIRSRVEQALERLRPALQADGGDVELVDVHGSVARVKMVGACGGCPMSMMTLKAGIEAAIVESVPEITSVEAV